MTAILEIAGAQQPVEASGPIPIESRETIMGEHGEQEPVFAGFTQPSGVSRAQEPNSPSIHPNWGLAGAGRRRVGRRASHGSHRALQELPQPPPVLPTWRANVRARGEVVAFKADVANVQRLVRVG